MKRLTALFLLIFALAAQAGFASPVAVIVNSANTQNVSQADVRSIYVDKTIAWANGNKIAVYNLPPGEAAAEIFARNVLMMSARDAASAESNRAINNTARNPQQEKRAALVLSIVAKTPHAIGYVPKELTEGKPGIRVLFTLE